MARLMNTVKTINQSVPNVIFLNGGDMFQGNVWYSQFKWEIIAQFTNYLNFTASVRQLLSNSTNPSLKKAFYIKSSYLTRISFYISTEQSLGNHEFDDGIAGFLPFAKNVSYPLVCANCDFSQYPDIKDLIKPYITKVVGGNKIGIIGYLTIDTSVSSDFKIELKKIISF